MTAQAEPTLRDQGRRCDALLVRRLLPIPTVLVAPGDRRARGLAETFMPAISRHGTSRRFVMPPADVPDCKLKKRATYRKPRAARAHEGNFRKFRTSTVRHPRHDRIDFRSDGRCRTWLVPVQVTRTEGRVAEVFPGRMRTKRDVTFGRGFGHMAREVRAHPYRGQSHDQERPRI